MTDGVNGRLPLIDEDCYRALQARDARFDGCFFTGVRSTGIYCRPVCRVKTPRRENCQFFQHAAQAEYAGFRPCLRCRPELAPQALHWSAQDATGILLQQAARWLDSPEAWGQEACSMQALADRLGVTDRHLRRIFEAHLGVSPLQYLQTRRLHSAKQLLTDTQLPVTQIALLSGFASVRRFHAAFAAHYQLQPGQLRRTTPQGGSSADCSTVRLGYRPPYDVPAMLAFWHKRSINAMEYIAEDAEFTWIRRSFCMQFQGQAHSGWLQLRFDVPNCQVVLQVSGSLRGVLLPLIQRTRQALDTDADPAAIHSVLQADFPQGAGLRVPGCFDAYELAVRAVLGQQISVAAARTLAARLVERLGTPISTPWADLNRLFPPPAVLAAASDALGPLGIVKQRQTAIVALAQAVDQGRLPLHSGVDVAHTISLLKSLPGIGDWTAQYIAMRALRWPDAFPAGDIILQQALGLQGMASPRKRAEAAEAAAQRWQPWRSYAVLRAWQGLLHTPASELVAPPCQG